MTFLSLAVLVQRFRPHGLLGLGAAVAAAEFQAMRNPKNALTPDSRDFFSRKVESCLRFCETAGLGASLASSKRVLELCAKDEATLRELADLMVEVNGRLDDEMEASFYYAVPPDRTRYLRPLLFGEEVADRFPEAVADIEEAGKCLAFGRGTAAVFHLMRVMEGALRSLGKQLGIPYAPSWESYLTQITSKINTKHKKKGIRWKRDEPYFRDVLGDLTAVKVAWRNPTMHIVRQYTPDEASDVLVAVRAFLRRIEKRDRETANQ